MSDDIIRVRLPTLAYLNADIRPPENWRTMTLEERGDYFLANMTIQRTLDWNVKLVRLDLVAPHLKKALQAEEAEWKKGGLIILPGGL